ncbi:MAG: tRNA (N6-isopentenyl adenosine(37)-C2)-methylthiotransferase MiaB [Clostridia bacterium]|nr:tRNA (N6-isopentenyl adenosine(37)-C2)-methylthiotransferase MiaB [Clostridia bacterium]
MSELNKNISDFDEFQKQEQYINALQDILYARAGNKQPLAMVRTYGCQQNVADSEKIKGMFEQMGCSLTDNEEDADIIIFNTCAVREHAEDRVFGNVGALKPLKKKKPSLFIGLCGCMMEQEHIAEKIYKSYPYVSLVFGTHEIQRFPVLLYEAVTSKRIIARGQDDGKIYEGIPIHRDGSFKGWLPIMYGCDNFCSYCIVPYVRGRERSRKPDIILNDAREMVKAGFKDITLLGQNVNSYGKGLDEDIDFATLLKQVSDIDGDFRVRFMTSHPKDVSKKLIDTIAENDKICNHIHLPVQCGSDRILKRMNRKYDTEKYLEIVDYAKSKIPDLSITSDIIVGFPGETYEDFQQTLDLIRKVEFTSLFTFIYSARVGTPAAKMDDPVPYEEKAKWMSELLKVQEEIAAKRCAAMVGKTYRVLVEEQAKNGMLSSRTANNIIVEFDGSKDLIGTFCDVEVTQARNWILRGKKL